MAHVNYQFLKQKKIPFEIIKYDHGEKGAEFAAAATGFPLEATVKTLVVDLGEKQYSLVLMPGDRQLSMKRLAKVCGVKRAAMGDTRTAERITGYPRRDVIGKPCHILEGPNCKGFGILAELLLSPTPPEDGI